MFQAVQNMEMYKTADRHGLTMCYSDVHDEVFMGLAPLNKEERALVLYDARTNKVIFSLVVCLEQNIYNIFKKWMLELLKSKGIKIFKNLKHTAARYDSEVFTEFAIKLHRKHCSPGIIHLGDMIEKNHSLARLIQFMDLDINQTKVKHKSI